ncbi:DUF4114 domain-containing protein [Aquimarina sp. U1-2]|uniref:DUF6923 family protein n=1 Tax=Aquimarina sp. U1-2 TaxID=2823141 RepID=UPI001AECD674|nr:DUF4114 domain-containing protein [Aquimarina sp. U1-2]MBP2831627.1 DUF4114 domain-containing protein [Aquimarina sp. U1-2]
MKKIITLFILLMLQVHTSYAQQPFDCNEGKFYQVISGALRSYDPITGTYSDPLHTHTAYNAGGYNPVDNFLYAIRSSDKHLLRIGKDVVVDLGAVAPNGAVQFGGGYAADVDDEGNLWVFQNALDKRSFHKVLNLQSYNGSSAPVFEIIVSNQASPSSCADIVFIDGNLYGGSRGNVYKWDLSTAIPTFSSTSVTDLPNHTFGACYTDTSNRLYVSSNNGGLYLVNDYETTSPYASLLNNTEVTNSNDGFKCAGGISPIDADNDEVLDPFDKDTDGDGIPDLVEGGGTDPYGDDDGDGIFNYLDPDFGSTCNSGVSLAFDTDRDGVPNVLDLDSDNDGIFDIVEAGLGSYDTNGDGLFNTEDANYIDSDLDGIADVVDIDQTGTAFYPADTDGDLIYDPYDIDADQDGIIDLIEGQNSTIFVSLSGNDTDRDGMDDIFDPDNGGTPQGLINTDGTDNPDFLDTDSNNDGVLDTVDAYDTNSDGNADTVTAGTDFDQDGLDDNFDLKRTVFDSENNNQNPGSFPVLSIRERYQYLGTFDGNGTPDYLSSNETLSSEYLNRITNALPEGSSIPDLNPQYIYSGYDTDVILESTTNISVTFIDENTSYKNVLGYYTYNINSPLTSAPYPEDITIIFPNGSKTGSSGGLNAGNTVDLGSFPAETGIGWVLLTDGWNGTEVNSGLWQLYSNADYNPECDEALQPHTILLADTANETIVLGFEDARRDYPEADQDFNDILFHIKADQYGALKTSNIPELTEEGIVTSGNDGGLESNGDLATLIAKRNFLRSKTNTVFNQKKLQQKFAPGTTSYANKNGADLSHYFPTTGATGTETSYVSSPEDLIGITNANAVFSIDYYNNDNRVGAALAMATKGAVYDHSKTICDRLNGSIIEDIRTLIVRNHPLVNTRIKRVTGEIEYALHFSVRIDEYQNELYSLWNIEDYPVGNYLNFQIWGGSISQAVTIANTVIDKLISQKSLGKTFISNNIPQIFIQKGFYRDGKLTLSLVNKSKASQLHFRGNKRATESSSEELITKIISLSGAYQEIVTIDTGYLFDIGFAIAGEDPKKADILYLADGPWGIDYKENGVTISDFNISENEKTEEQEKDDYLVERNAEVHGSVKETINLFRNILGGDLSLDISEYDAISFELYTDQDVELILVSKELTDWNNRLKYKIKANTTLQKYVIPFSDFSSKAKQNTTIKDLRSVVFSVQGDYQTFIPFKIKVHKLAFTNQKKIENEDPETIAINNDDIEEASISTTTNRVVQNSPNPFSSRTTIKMPSANKRIMISVVDMLGRIVQEEEIKSKGELSDTFEFTAKNLARGVYKYSVRGDDFTIRYIGSFLIR